MATLVSKEEALAYIEQEDTYTGEEYKRLDTWTDQLEGDQWMDDTDLPHGWKKKEQEEEESLFLEERTGTILSGRVALIKYLINNEVSHECIMSLWDTLDMEGWMTDDRNLPPGWKSKYDLDSSQFQYLSPLMDVVEAPMDLLTRQAPSDPDYI